MHTQQILKCQADLEYSLPVRELFLNNTSTKASAVEAAVMKSVTTVK